MVSCHNFNNYLSIATISLNTILIAAGHSELKIINVVFRHGDRTPDNNGREMFPNDPYVNYSFYPTGLGQLTIEGKKHEYRLGKFLRSRYNDFLGSLYTPKILIARSSDYERTKMSLQLVLASLFPPKSVQRWNPLLNWQPIPTLYAPRVDDNIILADECPQYLEEYNRIVNSPEGQEKIGQFKDLMGNLTKLTNKKIETVEDLYFLYHTFVAESSLGLILPEWAYDYFPYGPLFDGIVAAYNISNFTPLIRRLFAGPMIRAMTDNMIAAQNPNIALNTKIYLYSGHETNVASMLHAFGVYKPHVPEYSSAVILELQQIEQEYYVKLVYYRGIPPTAKDLKIPGCDILCPFDTYLDLINDLIPSDEEMICDKRQTPSYAGTEYPITLGADNMVSLHIFENHYLSISLVIGLNVILLTVAQPELKLVNVVFRHGDRTPDNGYEMYPNDPYLNYSFYPEGLGQLTITGKMRQYKLGQILHSRYKEFLGDLYLPKLVVAHSSDYDRTKMSLQLVLAALFPSNVRQQWNPVLNWQPIPTSYVTRVNDNFFLPDECPQYLNEYDGVLNLPKTQKQMSQFTNLMNELTKLTGKKIEKPIDFYYLYHTFMSESFLNLTLPKWAYDYFPDGPLFDAIIAAYNISNSTPTLKRLYAGPIIRTIWENMLAVQNASSNTKIYLYSGHETNIATLLHAFNVYKPHVPEYSSAIILELLQQNDQYYVKILHYQGIPPIINELKIPDCETICPFNKFSDIIRDLLPSDKEMVCDKRQTRDYADTEYPATLETNVYNLIINKSSTLSCN
ncbi:PREDICTED: uncharacterized protein LOC108780391 [Cyphomyrmex costatus]|uniref:uncharacterized protein LOC108780391 n=1 Tax=Cyphomyrmex costatus TaxID=456900 RepID=UPI0008522AE4|nr:PREDICTED: uncharacterized protein LOC108780391 [Cyphomyrmex costatus]